MPKRDTRLEIAEICHTQVVEASLASVRVNELIKAAGVNRNTFYYHYSSKYDVVEWYFRRDLAQHLRHVLPESQLVYRAPGAEPDAFASLPYYARREVAARAYDHSLFMKALITCIADDAPFYRKLFTAREMEFVDYAKGIWREAFLDDIALVLDGRYLPEETRLILADNCASVVVNSASFCLGDLERTRMLLDDDVNPFWNAIPEALNGMIRKYPVNPKPTRRG